MIQKLISFPPSVPPHFEQLTGKKSPEWIAGNDPIDKKLGSGGGTVHSLIQGWEKDSAAGELSFEDWLQLSPKIVIHSGGHGRRLPAYASSGKSLTPIPVVKWARGQKLNQSLLDLQTQFLERFIKLASPNSRCLIASGDVLVRCSKSIPSLPEADVVCLGLWSDVETASRHGVFFVPRQTPGELAYMRQKPNAADIAADSVEYLFLLDIGIWLLSERAVRALFRISGHPSDWHSLVRYSDDRSISYCDLYKDLGLCLGTHPTVKNEALQDLSCTIVPLEGGEFYHFGRNSDLVQSSLELQNSVSDQRSILSPLIKPHPSIFVLNAVTNMRLLPSHQNVWIENACLAENWVMHRDHVITGVPENDWSLNIPPGMCLDMMPIGETDYGIRVYGMDNTFNGLVGVESTLFGSSSVREWFKTRGMSLVEVGLNEDTDIQQAKLFPVVPGTSLSEGFIQWLLDGSGDTQAWKDVYLSSVRLSADDISQKTHLLRLFQQRKTFLQAGLPMLASHGDRSVFYQLDLASTAELFWDTDFPLPDYRPDPLRNVFNTMHDRMFRHRVLKIRGQDLQAENYEKEAFGGLRQTLIQKAGIHKQAPLNSCLPDQIIWARSPLRLDLAGGWTDTPPHCFLHGGSVVNLAVELNGQPPIQVFARICEQPHIILKSIDLGVSARIQTYRELSDYDSVGSGFAIAKAALSLAGFQPEFSYAKYDSLEKHLLAFGGGIELSLLAAVPKGSGLGTSSILSATLLGVLNEMAGLGWDLQEIGFRTLVLEQMLTTGGGWQDQFGGLLRGVKWLKTVPGLDQNPEVRWLPDHFFTDDLFRASALLYYTGITRVAKSILAEIVRGMFLNSSTHLGVLQELDEHACRLYETLQSGEWNAIGNMVGKTWELNQTLDPGANPPEVQKIIHAVQPWISGCKLLGAGGGGYLLILANDPNDALKIRRKLQSEPPNGRARFVDFKLSQTGFQITRS